MASIFSRMLDALLKSMEQNHNLTMVLRQGGVTITGKWKTREVFMGDERLSLELLDRAKISHDLKAFHWGDGSQESSTTALAILLWFLPRPDALNMRDRFLKDYVSCFSRDFKQWFPYPQWQSQSTRDQKLEDTDSEPPE